jgi:predicted deacylase
MKPRRNTATIVTVSVAALITVGVGGWLVFGMLASSARPPVVGTTAVVSITTATASPATATPKPVAETTSTAPEKSADEGPERIGQSVKGTPIVAYRFGSGERRFLVIGGVHGDEYGIDVAEALVKRLSAEPSLVPAGIEIHVIPSVNPDGEAANTRGNANDVDLNRNFPSKNWTSKLPAGDTSARREGLSGGKGAGSEPETKAMVDYLRRKFVNVVSLHSEGGIVDFDGPGGPSVAKRVSKAIGLPVDHVGYQSSVHGSMGLYIPETYSIPIITIELNSPKLTDKTLDGILAAIN